MDSEEQFWLTLWKIVGAAVVAFTAVLATSCQVTNYRIAQAIEAGTDPIAARCALAESASADCVFVYANAE